MLDKATPRTFDEYRAMITIPNCPDCGTPLPRDFRSYDHPNGYAVLGCEKPQWLYIECLRCQYQWAFWKLLRYSGKDARP